MKNTLFLCVTVSLMVMSSGCEQGGGRLGDGHDFGANDPNRYVVMGDSISTGGGAWPAILAEMTGNEVVNEASDGESSGGGASRVSGVLASQQPGYLLILYGANDVIRGASSSSIVENLRHMVQEAKANQTIPVVATLTPMTEGHSIFDGGVDAVNPQIAQMADEEGVAVVRLDEAFGDGAGYLNSDGLHPNEAGQQLIAQCFYDTLM